MRETAGLLHPARALQLIALLTPPLAVVAPRALAIVLPLAALVGAAGAWRAGALRWPPRLPIVLLAALLVWSAASATWALHPRLVWSDWGQIAGLGLAGVILLGLARDAADAGRLRILLALAAGVAIALGLLAIELASSLLLERSVGAMISESRPFRIAVFNRGAACLAILVWPAAYAVHLRYGPALAAALVTAALLIVAQFASMAAIVGLGAGLVVWVLAAWRPRAVGLALMAAVVVGAAVAPLLPRIPAAVEITERRDIKNSVAHRLVIWRFAAESIAQRPLLGWGLNASRDLPGREVLSPAGQSMMSLHPHNAILQLWLELGAVGAAIGAAFLLAAIQGAMRLDAGSGAATRLARASALALVSSGTLVAAVGYGIWQAWWMAALWIAAALAAVATKGEARF